MFWIKRLDAFSKERNGLGRAEFCVAAVQEFESMRGILKGFYSFDVVASQPARRDWIPPDLRELA